MESPDRICKCNEYGEVKERIRESHILASSGINWIEFIEFDVKGLGIGYAVIKRLWREHKTETITKTTSNIDFRLLEDSKRIVKAIHFGTRCLPVENSKHIFEY